MTLSWMDAYETTAIRCGLCHDQCVSACPVVASSRTQQAYPSRLATLAGLLKRGELEPSPAVMAALQLCIHCNACTAACVYLDQPVDVTPLVRWGRGYLVERGFASEPARRLLETVTRYGNPYGGIGEPLQKLRQAAGDLSTGGTLVIPDSYGLLFDPQAAVSAVKLLDRLGFPGVSVSETAYLGWELWQYGYSLQATRIARQAAEEIERMQPSRVVALSPAEAFLLRQVYPSEIGVSCPCPVLTLPEAVLEAYHPERLTSESKSGTIGLVLTYAETCQLKSLAAREVLLLGGAALARVPELQPYSWMSFPEGQAVGLDPDPGLHQARRLAARAKVEGVEAVVCTSAHVVQAFRHAELGLPVYDWATYVLSSIL